MACALKKKGGGEPGDEARPVHTLYGSYPQLLYCSCMRAVLWLCGYRRRVLVVSSVTSRLHTINYCAYNLGYDVVMSGHLGDLSYEQEEALKKVRTERLQIHDNLYSLPMDR